MKTRLRAIRRSACWAIGVAIFPLLARAASDQPTYALSWSRADGARECITASALAKAVEARLGRSVFVSTAVAEFMLEARIDGGPSMWSATISLLDREGRRIGQRDLTSTERDCRALDQSLSLMLALAIDPNATLAVAAPPGETPAPVVAPRQPAPGLPPVVVARALERPNVAIAPSPSAEQRVPTAYAEGSLRMSLGMLPGAVVPGVEVAAVLPLHESWVARVGAVSWLPTHGEGTDGGVFLSQFAVALGLCGRLRGSSAFVLLCAGAEPGLVAAAGYGFNRTVEQDRRFTLMAGPSAKVGIQLGGRFWAQLGGDLLVPIIRHQFYYVKADDTHMEVFRSSAVTGAAGLTVLLAFP
jgi:hypothetical protein